MRPDDRGESSLEAFEAHALRRLAGLTSRCDRALCGAAYEEGLDIPARMLGACVEPSPVRVSRGSVRVRDRNGHR
jgi:hypothetical protein